jgi:hypothetical protein
MAHVRLYFCITKVVTLLLYKRTKCGIMIVCCDKITLLHAVLNHDRLFLIRQLRLHIINKLNSKQCQTLISDRTITMQNDVKTMCNLTESNLFPPKVCDVMFLNIVKLRETFASTKTFSSKKQSFS